PVPRPAPAPPADALDPAAAIDALGAALPPDARVVLEAPSATLAVRNRLRISTPRSYFFGAGGGLGFGLPAALGVQLADPSRPVVAVLGEGSAQYAIQALWTAATYDIPVTILILRNDEYAILRWFGGLEGLDGVPALDLPALDTAALSAAYGVPAERAASADDLPVLLRDALAAPGPRLIEVPVRPGMALV
ncbi:MAG: thiamine pyrophosphate-dependent enzyme, partial [Solirubrobacteraceae bacterium]